MFDLRRREGHSDISADELGATAETGWHIHGNHPRASNGIDRPDASQRSARSRPFQTGSKKRIDDQRRLVDLNLGRFRHRDHLQRRDPIPQQARDHTAIASVVPLPAKNDDALEQQWSKLALDHFHHAPPRVFHQHFAGSATLDRQAVRFAHLLGRQNLHADAPVSSCSRFRNPSGRPITIR